MLSCCALLGKLLADLADVREESLATAVLARGLIRNSWEGTVAFVLSAGLLANLAISARSRSRSRCARGLIRHLLPCCAAVLAQARPMRARAAEPAVV